MFSFLLPSPIVFHPIPFQARTAFGFVYPDSRFGLTTKMRDDRLGDGDTLPPNEENYALDYHVHRAQCRPEGIYHVVTGAF